MLYGLFEATSPPLDRSVPNAWTGQNDANVPTPLPVQIPFRIILNGPPIPAPDPEVMMILNGLPPVERIGALNIRQTKALANIVAIRSGVWSPSGGHSGSNGRPPQSPLGMGRGGGMGPGGGTGAGATPGQFYRPPFKYNQTIPVNISFTGDGYTVRKRSFSSVSLPSFSSHSLLILFSDYWDLKCPRLMPSSASLEPLIILRFDCVELVQDLKKDQQMKKYLNHYIL